MGMNKVSLVGAVVRSNLRNTAKLTPVMELTVAGVDRVGEKEFAWYHQVNYLGRRAERLAEVIQPGAGAIVSGTLEYRAWETPEGERRTKIEVVARDLEVFVPRGEDLTQDSQGNPRLTVGAVNHVQLVGNLTRDPERSERGPAKAGLAVNEWVPGKGGEKGSEKTHFFDILAWNGAGEALMELRRGDPIYVEGRLVAESWEAGDGSKRYATRVEVLRLLTLLHPKREEEEALPI
jgi:single-strand DNA-binding protein